MVERHLPEGAMQGVDKEGLQIFFTSELRFFAERIQEKSRILITSIKQKIYLIQLAFLVDYLQMEVMRLAD
jgi:hypothetical protein